jgi:hypothetical protein
VVPAVRGVKLVTGKDAGFGDHLLAVAVGLKETDTLVFDLGFDWWIVRLVISSLNGGERLGLPIEADVTSPEASKNFNV